MSQQHHVDAIFAYRDHSHREVARVKRNLFGLSPDDIASLTWKPEDQVQKMQKAAEANIALLEKIADIMKQTQSSDGGPAGRQGRASSCQGAAGIKAVQNLLQSFVREWTTEGFEERRGCFERLLGALDAHLGASLQEATTKGTSAPRVLCPGTLLGRLIFEVRRKGYACEGCESRALSFFGSEFVRQHCAQKEIHRIQPFALNTCNRFKAEDHVRTTPVPDVEIGEGALPPIQFGDFVKLYDSASACGSFDALLTAFALDTSANIFRYVRTAAHVVKPGGLWANFGPLAYDTDHDEARGHGMEISWEELKYAISQFFKIQANEEFVDSLNAANGESMMQTQYTCIYFTAVRNDKPAVGIGGT